MKKLFYLILIVLLVVGFYVAWPGWSAYQIHNALVAKDADTLERKIDFPSVRASLRKAAADKLGQLYVPPQAGPSSPVLAERLKQDAVARLVEGALDSLVTPSNLVLLISEGGALKDGIERMLRDQMTRGGQVPGMAGAGGGAGKRGPVFRTVTSGEPTAAPGYGLGNIKRIGILGPLSYEIGVAKNATAPTADVLVEFSFTGTDWKVTAVRPAL